MAPCPVHGLGGRNGEGMVAPTRHQPHHQHAEENGYASEVRGDALDAILDGIIDVSAHAPDGTQPHPTAPDTTCEHVRGGSPSPAVGVSGGG